MKKNLLTAVVFLFCISHVWSQAPDWLWAQNALPVYSSIGSGGIVTDAAGNVYVTGYFGDATIAFGNFTLNNANTDVNQLSDDIFIVKYGPSGNVIWARRDGGINNEVATGIALDASGNVYVTGYFYSAAIYGPDTTVFGSSILVNDSSDLLNDMFIVKYDNNGHELWARSAGGNGNDQSAAITCDQLGNVYVVGSSYSDSIGFGAFGLDTAVMFFVKYDSTGKVIWANRAGGDLGSQEYDLVNTVAADRYGNVYMAGCFFSDSISFGSFSLHNANGGNQTAPFLIKCNTNGTVLWAKSGVSYPAQSVLDHDEVFSIAPDASGNIYMAGAFGSDSLRIGVFTLVSPHLGSGIANGFAVKWDSTGKALWANSVESSSAHGNVPYSIATGNAGDIYIGGYYDESDTLQFGASVSVHAICTSTSGNIDMFVVNYDSKGDAVWAQQASGKSCPGMDICYSIASDPNGNLYTIGTFTGDTLAFGSATLINQADSVNSFFIAKLAGTTNGIPELKGPGAEVTIFPNPAQDAFTVQIGADIQAGRLQVFDMLGNTMLNEDINNYYPRTNKLIQLSVPAGVYLVTITDGQQRYLGKIVITQ